MFYILSTVVGLWAALLLIRYRITRRFDRKLNPAPTPNLIPPVYGDGDTHRDYLSHIQLLFHQIGHRYERPLPPNRDFLEPFHDWLHFTSGAASTWNAKKLDALEHTTSALIERAYPYADTKKKMLMGKLSAMAIGIDDSIDDNDMYNEVEQFAHRIYLGEAQPPGILGLYHESIMELSSFHEGDAVRRGLAVIPWITFADACLLEQRMVTEDLTLQASPLDIGLSKDTSLRLTPLTEEATKFPHYLRQKTGVAEAYATAIFKANKEQELPLSGYIKAMPDISFFIEVMNDILSFHKEELAGETSNLIHLRTQVLRFAPPCNGSGPSGEWTVSDTIRVLCEELRDATHRIDALLRLEENEMRDRKNKNMGIEEADVDIDIAKQWRGFRDGYISWHLECQRYKLDFLRPRQFHGC